ncbi:hypothetical protein [Komagataeibacter oboediens]|uniref:N,N-dimethylformamidase alpha subunit domain-containing protein n=1 Tax=Komagataeibacter oboediens TaxID=65958 RepID=A0ABS5SP55_9PROT|nr:hypothetical protein [Komagataeibacter oboediens]MBL7234115.1 hypothetical protein [Komagataeibacter oboediens]MBT0675989.1 hypothetical protein [Komagataeibacter oboediens]MBT0679169.1 hypothetical protein [Komagataeibacter oboediens]
MRANAPRIDPADLDPVREFRACPIGLHSPALEAMLNILRAGTMGGKYCIICLEPHRKWALGRLSGIRGVPPEVVPDVEYDDLEEAEWDVFRRRWEAETGTRLPPEFDAPLRETPTNTAGESR